jgi:hypothetical protein
LAGIGVELAQPSERKRATRIETRPWDAIEGMMSELLGAHSIDGGRFFARE